MRLVESISSEIDERLRRTIDPNETLRIGVATDIAEDGRFGKRWLIVTDRRLLVLSGEEKDQDGRLELPVRGIKSAKTEPLVGGGRLEVETDGRTMELLRYSNSLVKKFVEVARGIEQLAKGEALDIPTEEEKLRCDKCGRLLPEKNGICPACVRKGAVLLRIASYLKPYRRKATVLVLLTLVGTLIQLVPPYLTKMLIDDVLNPKPGASPLPLTKILTDLFDLETKFGLLVVLVAGMFAAGFLRMIGAVGHGWIASWVGARVTMDIRAELYRCLEMLSLKFYDKRQTGALMSRVTNDSGMLEEFLVDGLPYLTANILMLFGIGVVLLGMNWQLALFALIPTPLLGFGGGLFWRKMLGIFHKWWRKWARFSALLNESISGIRVVKAFAQEETEIYKFGRRNRELFVAGTTAGRIWFTFFASMTFFTSSGAIIVWLVGGKSILMGGLTLGTLIAFTQYLWHFYGPLQWLGEVNHWMSRAFAGAERIFEVIDTEPETYDAPDAVPMPKIKGEVTFKNATFGYEVGKTILQNIDLEVKAGEMVGLVGKSGVGKSTMINLICHFYDVNEGAIQVDGVDILKIKLKDLRSQIGMVLQEPFLFSGTIAENIAYGKPNATFEEIVEAARAANAHNFIVAKPDGYDTQVGERGSKLSVGEKQRTSIARAILHNPSILILDEATSSVDTETERQIQEALARLVKGRTTFAIAHRLSTLRNADRLVVMEEGKISEVGTHDELVAKEGAFYKLVQMQMETSRIIAVHG